MIQYKTLNDNCIFKWIQDPKGDSLGRKTCSESSGTMTRDTVIRFVETGAHVTRILILIG